MRLKNCFETTANLAKLDDFSIFQSHIDPDWIEDVLQASGTATIRRRRLPMDQVLWLILGIGLYRNRPIYELVTKLNLALPGVRGPMTARSAISQARKRLGEEPIRWLFERCSQEWAHASAAKSLWRGLKIYGVDGSTLRVPDSEENKTYFGGPSCGAGNKYGYPVVRLVTLMALRSHLLAAATLAPYCNSEMNLSNNLWGHVPSDSLVILDKGFLSLSILHSLQVKNGNRHWLIRAKKNTKMKLVKKLGSGDELVELKTSKAARQKNPELPDTLIARAITYQREGFQPQIVLTSLLDASQYPAKETAALYHERWELEMGYDEVKTEMLVSAETMRSKSPSGVRQEIWGTLLSYNLIRLEMEKIADEAKVEPTRISFVMALRLIQDEWMWCAITSPGNIPKYLKKLRQSVKDFILPPRRQERSYPRSVKVAKKRYPCKNKALSSASVLK